MRRRSSDYTLFVCDLFLKLVFVYPFRLIMKLVNYIKDKRYEVDMSDYPDDDEWIDDSDNEQAIQDELYKFDNSPEMPEMCQVFCLGPDTCIGVQFVSMCPDETAHIRIIGESTFSQIYKRRVYRENTITEQRYFKLNNKKYYLDNSRTRPIDPTQAKEGK